MAYDKKTGTITVSSDDPQELERDIFRHFEEVTRQLSQDSNCPPEIAAEHEKLKKANKALDDYEKLKALTDQARSINQMQSSQVSPVSGVVIEKSGGVLKWLAISLNLMLLLTLGYMLVTKGAPREEDELFLVIVLFAAPSASLVALTRTGGESLLGLYFKRKALEEKQRIKNLGG